MTAAAKQLAESLFAEALELPAAERRAFVSSATSDAEVADRVSSLLEQEARRGDFMQTPAAIAPSPAPAPHVFKPDTVVAQRYRILRRISAGGMGEVYQAYDTKLERKIALKTILPRIAADAQAMSRFRHEVALATEVTHSNVCRVFDLGEHRDDGTAEPVSFLTMQLLEGESLAERLKKSGKLDPTEALPLIRQMAEALGAAHRVGVIHRDFKPSNVMLTPDGEGGERAVVTDFGLARNVDNEDRSSLTHSDQILGTPNYMAPEQWTGQPVSAATDIYTLGIVIHEMLTGARPGGPGAETLTAPQRETLDRCLERDPQNRPKTVTEVLESLDATPKKSVWRWAGAAIFVLLALGLLFLRFPNQEEIAASLDAKRVAVLPFRVGDEQLRVFADGLMEAVTQRLSQYDGLDKALLVTPASETRRQKVTTSGDARQNFGATHAVEATLNAEGDRLRLVLSIIDTASMQPIESQIVEGSRQKALSLQDDSVSSLASALGLGVKTGYERDQPPTNPDAHALYLNARGYLFRSDQVESVRQAVTLFQSAIELAPEYTLAHAGLSEALWRLYERTNDFMFANEALEVCRDAVELDAHSPEARVSCGRALAGTGKTEEALEEFRAAVQLDPRNGEAAEGIARAYETLGRHSEAEAAFLDSVRLRRADWQAYKQLGLFYYRHGRYDEAATRFQRVVDLTPNSAQAFANLGSAFYFAGQREFAKEAWQRSVDIEPRDTSLSNLGALLLTDRNYVGAARLFEQAVQLDPNDHRPRGNLAAAYFWSNDVRAKQSYKKAYELAGARLEANPARTELYSYLAHYGVNAGQIMLARDWLRQSVARESESANELIRNASTYERLGERDSAVQTVVRMIELGIPDETFTDRPLLKKVLDDPRVSSLLKSGK